MAVFKIVYQLTKQPDLAPRSTLVEAADITKAALVWQEHRQSKLNHHEAKAISIEQIHDNSVVRELSNEDLAALIREAMNYVPDDDDFAAELKEIAERLDPLYLATPHTIKKRS
jgi:hypothetical protein